MSKGKMYTEAEVIKFYSEAFINGCQYTTEMLTYLMENINEKHNAKHKKMLDTLLNSLMSGIAVVGKETVKKQVEKFFSNKKEVYGEAK